MRKAVKIICIALCAVILVGLGLYFIPWRTNIKLEMYGAVVTEDGEVVYTTQVKISGTKDTYLFKKDRYNVSLSLPESTIKSRTYKDGIVGPPVIQDPEYYPYISTSYSLFCAGINGFFHGRFDLSFDKNVLILTNFEPEGEYLVASTDPDFDPLEILETYLRATDS